MTDEIMQALDESALRMIARPECSCLTAYHGDPCEHEVCEMCDERHPPEEHSPAAFLRTNPGRQ